jgi:glycosyl transferase, family 25
MSVSAFPPIYFINLASRQDRRASMERQLSALGLVGTRIEAVTPADLSPAVIDEFCNPDRDDSLSPTTLGCSLSHLAALSAFMATDAPFAVVLEDDVVLSSRLPSFLSALLRDRPEAGLIRIETSMRGIRAKKAERTLADVEIIKPYSWESGSAGYVVSRQGAEAILAAGQQMKRRQPDIVLFRPFTQLSRRVALRQTNPALCIQSHHIAGASFGSDMRPPTRERTVPMNLFERLRHEASNVWRREIAVGIPQTWHQLLGAKKRKIRFAE